MTTTKTQTTIQVAYAERKRRQDEAKERFSEELRKINVDFTTMLQAERDARRMTMVKAADEIGVSRGLLQELVRRYPPRTA
jgi:hypothetical protein